MVGRSGAGGVPALPEHRAADVRRSLDGPAGRGDVGPVLHVDARAARRRPDLVSIPARPGAAKSGAGRQLYSFDRHLRRGGDALYCAPSGPGRAGLLRARAPPRRRVSSRVWLPPRADVGPPRRKAPRAGAAARRHAARPRPRAEREARRRRSPAQPAHRPRVREGALQAFRGPEPERAPRAVPRRSRRLGLVARASRTADERAADLFSPRPPGSAG